MQQCFYLVSKYTVSWCLYGNDQVFVQQIRNAVVAGVQATMVEPTIAADGHTYERNAIQNWVTHSRMSPVTGHPLSHTRLVSNQAARVAIASQLGRVQ